MGTPRTPQADFRNRLCILMAIDRSELAEAGVEITDDGWRKFFRDPWLWLIRATDADAAKVWVILEARSAP